MWRKFPVYVYPVLSNPRGRSPTSHEIAVKKEQVLFLAAV